MAETRQGRFAIVAATSVGLHALLIGYLAHQHPTLVTRATPDHVFDVTILPRYVIDPPRSTTTPIRPRLARLPPEASSIAPLPVAPAFVPTVTNAGQSPNAPTIPEPVDLSGLGRALRSGGLGCRDPELAGLSREERARCLERLGNNAKNAPYYRPGINPGKQATLDAWGAKKSLRWKRDHEQVTGFGHLTTDGGPTMVPIPDTIPTPKGPREIRIPF